MPANVCQSCDIAWPSGQDFKRCADCGGPTIHSTTTQRDFTFVEARKRAAFREYYEGYDAERERRGDPTPEQIGALEARRELATIRELEATAAL